MKIIKSSKSLKNEKITIKAMIELYCRYKHNTNESLCSECESLLNYSIKRIDLCTFGVNKPACSSCTIHCYNQDFRNKVKEVMRFSGPKMLLHHPILAIRHLWHKYFETTKNNNNND